MPATYVSVIGGSTCTAAVAALGEQLGELLAERGCVVVERRHGGRHGGGGPRGAASRRHLCRHPAGPRPPRRGPDLSLSLLTGMGHARNLAVVASGDVVIALGGSWGTLSEIGLARSIGREVVLLESWGMAPPQGVLDGLHRATVRPGPSSSPWRWRARLPEAAGRRP